MKHPPVYKPNPRMPWVPDQMLIQTLVEHGQPRRDAIAGVNGMRFFATSFYFDVQAAARGDKKAKERVDYCRHVWNEMSRES